MATPAHPRKTSPKVRDGRVQKKNRWAESVDADDALLGKLGICFEARAPGPGRRHVLTEVDVRRFLRCIPDWESHAEGLSAIVLGNSEDSMGAYDSRGIIYRNRSRAGQSVTHDCRALVGPCSQWGGARVV